jgi:inosose dehydratase
MTGAERIAAAPISWGVCEVPGWGEQLGPERVLGEMRDIGIAATEAGPEGFLPEPAQAAELVRSFGLRLVGGFVPATLHARGGIEAVERAAELFSAADADVLIVAAVGTADGYDARPELSADAWRALLDGLDAAGELCAARGLACALHPHVGTVVEDRADVERVLEASTVDLCLDTGHLLIGGTDPVALARDAAERVSHVHLKDVDAELVTRVLAGELAYSDAVRAGLYRPLGQGALDVGGLVASLEGRGYDGWYVLEQDLMLDAAPAAGEGPLHDVRASAEMLRSMLATSTIDNKNAGGSHR